MGFTEHMSEGILTTIIGMGVVFFVLITLSLCIRALNYIVDTYIDKKKVESTEKNSLKLEGKVTDNLETNMPLNTNSPLITAIVTASMSALYGNTSKDFIIKEIRSVGK